MTFPGVRGGFRRAAITGSNVGNGRPSQAPRHDEATRESACARSAMGGPPPGLSLTSADSLTLPHAGGGYRRRRHLACNAAGCRATVRPVSEGIVPVNLRRVTVAAVAALSAPL